MVIPMARPVKTPDARNVAINFSLSMRLLTLIDEQAARSGLSRSGFMRAILERALEDAEDIEIAQARLADESDEWVPLDRLVAGARR
jgi:hypothetical protein